MQGLEEVDKAKRILCVLLIIESPSSFALLVVYRQHLVISFVFRSFDPIGANEAFARFADLPAVTNCPVPSEKLLRLGWHYNA